MPRQKLTSAQIASCNPRMAAGESASVIAKEYGIHRCTIIYHARGGKASVYIFRPWRSRIQKANRKIRTGEYKQAAVELRAAACFLEKHH